MFLNNSLCNFLFYIYLGFFNSCSTTLRPPMWYASITVRYLLLHRKCSTLNIQTKVSDLAHTTMCRYSKNC